MFGHHDLYRDGVPARSVIISVLEGEKGTKHQTGQEVFYDVVARVEFGDGTEGQHRERLWYRDAGACTVGDVLPVRYDQQHRDKIVFDLPQLQASRYSPRERVDGRPARQPAIQVGPHAGNVSADTMRELLGELRADPQGFTDHLLRMAQEGGTNTFVFTSTTNITAPVQQSDNGVGFPVVDLNNDEIEDI
jgi:hypothetical protein